VTPGWLHPNPGSFSAIKDFHSPAHSCTTNPNCLGLAGDRIVANREERLYWYGYRRRALHE